MKPTTPSKNVVPQLFREAIGLHQAGRLADAQRIYDKILKLDRGNPDALNLKGAIAASSGRHSDALTLFNQAIARLPGFADVHFNKGNALAALGRNADAVAAYAEAIRLKPALTDARLNLSVALEAVGRSAEAIEALRAMTMSCPNDPRGHYQLAFYLEKRLSAGQSPDRERDAETALAALERARALAPADANVHSALASLCGQRRDYKAAVEHLQTAIALNPPWPDKQRAHTLSSLGEHLRQLERYGEAAEMHRKALALQPQDKDIRFNLATTLYATRELAEAELNFREVLRLDPTFVRAYINLGNVYRDWNRLDDAGDMFEQALTLDPSLAHAYSNLGTICADRGWFRTGLLLHDKAIALEDHPSARFKRGITLLGVGRLSEGWLEYDNRFLSPQEHIPARSSPPPYWRGEDLKEKSILVWTEQGLGDEILYANMIPEVLKRARSCVIECGARLIPVFARSFPSAVIRDRAQPPEVRRNEDYQIPIASLGRHFRMDFESFPKHRGYLAADAALTEKLRAAYRARAEGRRIVGISWRSKNEFVGLDKTATLSDLAPVLKNRDAMFVNLQYGNCTEELAAARDQLGADIFQDASVDPLTDVDAFFAQVAAMDLVITTSNTTAHAAGSQNVPVWILLPFAKGVLWYWFLRREDSPWYPSARLFRAPRFDPTRGWMREIAPQVAANLERFTAAQASKP